MSCAKQMAVVVVLKIDKWIEKKKTRVGKECLRWHENKPGGKNSFMKWCSQVESFKIYFNHISSALSCSFAFENSKNNKINLATPQKSQNL